MSGFFSFVKWPGAEASQGSWRPIHSKGLLTGWLTLHESLSLSGLYPFVKKEAGRTQKRPASNDI